MKAVVQYLPDGEDDEFPYQAAVYEKPNGGTDFTEDAGTVFYATVEEAREHAQMRIHSYDSAQAAKKELTAEQKQERLSEYLLDRLMQNPDELKILAGTEDAWTKRQELQSQIQQILTEALSRTVQGKPAVPGLTAQDISGAFGRFTDSPPERDAQTNTVLDRIEQAHELLAQPLTVPGYDLTVDFAVTKELYLEYTEEVYLGGIDSDGHERRDNYGEKTHGLRVVVHENNLVWLYTDDTDMEFRLYDGGERDLLAEEIQEFLEASDRQTLEISLTDSDGNRHQLELPQKVIPAFRAPADGEAAFQVYQMKGGEQYHFQRWESLENNRSAGLTLADYDLVYTGAWNGLHGDSSAQRLENLFRLLNEGDRPEGYTGHSLSVSDVIVVNEDGRKAAYYVDPVGFQEAPQLL